MHKIPRYDINILKELNWAKDGPFARIGRRNNLRELTVTSTRDQYTCIHVYTIGQ